MNRISLEDGTWFDLDKAQMWKEDTFLNGSNHISKATGSQWEHEALYRTAKGAFVLNRWSLRAKRARETYEEVSPETAIKWLLANGKDLEKMDKDFAKVVESLEV